MIKLKDILNESPVGGRNATDVFQKVPFGANPLFTKNFKFPFEPDTPDEEDLMTAFGEWYEDPSSTTAKAIKKYYPAIKGAKAKWPQLFSPGLPEKTPVYRGFVSNPKLIKLLKKTKSKDWSKTADVIKTAYNDAFGLYVYLKPIQYSPRREIQSWTTSVKIAKHFSGNEVGGSTVNRGGIILVTGLSDKFIMNPKFSDFLSPYGESEILHVDKTYTHPVYIATWDIESVTTKSDTFTSSRRGLDTFATTLINPEVDDKS